MTTGSWVLLMLAAVVTVGYGGYLLGRRNSTQQQEIDRLEQDLNAARQRADQIKAGVNTHFEQSAVISPRTIVSSWTTSRAARRSSGFRRDAPRSCWTRWRDHCSPMLERRQPRQSWTLAARLRSRMPPLPRARRMLLSNHLRGHKRRQRRQPRPRSPATSGRRAPLRHRAQRACLPAAISR